MKETRLCHTIGFQSNYYMENYPLGKVVNVDKRGDAKTLKLSLINFKIKFDSQIGLRVVAIHNPNWMSSL